jgi:hypothetical protein
VSNAGSNSPVVAQASSPAASSAASSAATNSAATSSAPINSTNLTGPLALQINGQTTTVLPNSHAIVTAVQNSLNNQLIQTRTSIDATLNSLSILRSGAFAASLRQQALDSVRR